MAQWTSPVVDQFPATLTNALRILRAASDAWARGGKASVPIDRVVAVIVHVLCNRYRREELPLSLSPCFEMVGSTTELFTVYSTSMRRSLFKAEALVEITQLLTIAADDWSNGDPESPPTAVVIHELATVLFKHGMIKRPPPPHIEE
jgi:hypothetical protein